MLRLNILLALILSVSILHASEDIEDALSGFDTTQEFDPLEGFGDEISIVEPEIKPKEKKSDTKLGGDIAFKTAYGIKEHSVDGVNYKGFNQAQSSLYLQLDSKLGDNFKLRVSGDVFYDSIYDIYTDKEYNDDTLDSYQTQARFDDVYVQGSLLDDLDMKLGRQIVIWGKSDSLRITDVINPLDNRQPGLTDIEDLRLPTSMLKLDYYAGDWELSAMAIAESRIMIEAAPRGEFFNVDVLSNNVPNPFLELEEPDSSVDNMQYAFAANGIFSGWDLSFYAADVLDQKWHFDKELGSVPLSSMKRVVSKIKMAGSALNIAYGSWLLKTEMAYLDGVKYNSTSKDKNRLDALIGFDYMGFKNTTISVEVANRHIFDHESQMKANMDFVEEDELQTALRYNQNFMNDTLDFSVLLSMFGESFQNGGFGRIWCEYDIIDALNTEFGYVEYIGGDKPFLEMNKDNDRLFANIKYSF